MGRLSRARVRARGRCILLNEIHMFSRSRFDNTHYRLTSVRTRRHITRQRPVYQDIANQCLERLQDTHSMQPSSSG